ncbi:nucleotide disphospho-sugar-binding domain-containing protein [Nucisporomicrobium flavum]|uniref:nucleotide disphospho-sugar-binding domain-containing protein n=1 Tax=Nucisporomicrobium flavum TaxID=2785915 RepID=UPI003C2D864A
MRVLFVTWAAPGHLYPMVPLAWALQAAGHDVRVAVPAPVADAVAGLGLSAVGVGHDVTTAEKGRRPELAEWGRPARWPAGWSSDLDLLDGPRRRVVRALYEKQVAVAAAMLDDLVDFGRWWRPDLIVHDVLGLAGPVLGAVLGVPAVGHGWEVGSTLHSPTDLSMADPLPSYRALFAAYGAEPAEPVGWIDICPPAMRLPDNPPVNRMDMRCVPYNGAATHPQWLARTDGPPRVCVSAGVAGARYRDPDGPDVLTLTLEALGDLDAEIVLAPSGALDESRLPPNVRVARGVPFRMLLPTCAVAVHHGGAGTALTAAVLGVPQVILPPAPICAEIGDRVTRAGVGTMIGPDGPDDTALLFKTVEQMMTGPEWREACARLRDGMAAYPSPAAMADTLADRWSA